MSLLAKIQGIRPSKILEEADLDLTPIMNLFIILVPSLVSIAVFVHIAVIQINLPSNSTGAGSGPRKSDLKLTVSMSPDRSYVLALGDQVLDSIPAVSGGFDLAKLGNSLQTVRSRLNNQDEIVVAVADGINFDQVVSTMDAGKQSGFGKVSLAAAAAEPPAGAQPKGIGK
jgi:biopolymer transport protein ExbD